MNAYEALRELSAGTMHLSATERRDVLWASLTTLKCALQEDLLAVFQVDPFLEQVTLYIDDPFYRQGSAAVILEFRFDPDDTFTIGATCVIDHAMISIRVTRPGSQGGFAALRQRIEEAGDVPLNRLA
jgi:hypothetical protein